MNWYLRRSALMDTATGVIQAKSIEDAERILVERYPTVAPLLYAQSHEDYIAEGGFDPIHLGM